ncbi:unnamed protein product [Spirodela intermedia]|uniref:Uncharacterized protein n=1 Tax=Spirodela intermedia TaxID=51605 RepID=A0A7I8LKM4_SPIIN|nr:unnamed protein product [Spirodela intermedia]
MQGQRSTVQFFPETLDYEHQSSSNSTTTDHQQGFWSSAVNPSDAHNVPGYLRGRAEVSMPYRHTGGHQDEGYGGWSLMGSSSSEPPISLDGYGVSEAAGNGWMASSAGYPATCPRFGERRLEARGHPFPHSSSSTDASGGIIDGGRPIPQIHAGPLYYPFAAEDDQRASTSGSSSSCGIFVRDGVNYLSDDSDGCTRGGFLDGRRQSGKRKNLEGPSGQTSGSSSGGPFHQADGCLLHSAPERNVSSGGLNISGARGAASEHPSLISVGGNFDGSQSTFRTRVDTAHHLDGSSPQVWPPGNPNLHLRACAPHYTSSLPNPFVQSLEARQAMPSTSSHQPHLPTVPALPPMVYPLPWSGMSNSRIGSSANMHTTSSESPGVLREEANPRGLERSNLPEHPLFVPAADAWRMAQDPGSWSLGNGNMIIPGNAGPFSLFSPSSGVHPPVAPSWVPHQGPTSQYLQISSELACRGSPINGSEHLLLNGTDETRTHKM